MCRWRCRGVRPPRSRWRSREGFAVGSRWLGRWLILPSFVGSRSLVAFAELTSGAEARSLLIVSMARLKPCPLKTADPSALPQDDICWWVRFVLPTLREEREGWGTLIAEPRILRLRFRMTFVLKVMLVIRLKLKKAGMGSVKTGNQPVKLRFSPCQHS